jgi:hypothetical protein
MVGYELSLLLQLTNDVANVLNITIGATLAILLRLVLGH